jgi:nitrate reductase beta subunit
MDKEKGIDFADSDAQYNPEKVPEKGHFYLPVQCQQCRNPQCVTVCPVKATWQEPDGIVVVDLTGVSDADIVWRPAHTGQGISIGANLMYRQKN